MKIHEYQAKAILAQYNVPVPRGEVAFTMEQAEAAAKKIGGSVVVKAGNTQWLSGGAFKTRGGAADPKLGDGFAFVKCAEGDGYLKAAYLP